MMPVFGDELGKRPQMKLSCTRGLYNLLILKVGMQFPADRIQLLTKSTPQLLHNSWYIMLYNCLDSMGQLQYMQYGYKLAGYKL